MKKSIFNIIPFIGLLSLFVFVGCSDDDDDILDPINSGPTIDVWVNGEEDGPFDATIGQTLVLTLDITDADGIDSVIVKKFVGGSEVMEETQTIYPTATGGDVNQNVEVSLAGVNSDEDVYIEVIAVDTEGNSNTETIELNISALGKYTTVLLFAPLSDESSQTFFSTSTGQTYSVNDVEDGPISLSGQIDFGYYYGATNMASLASPQVLNSAGIYDLGDWSVLNATQYKRTTITESEFLENEDNIEYISGVFNNEAGSGQNQVNNLQVGEVIAFQLSSGQGNRTGLIRVSDIEPGDGQENYIEIDVLVSYAQ